MSTHHFSDPHTAAIFEAIRASNAGITLAELQAEFPDEEDHPGQLRESINDMRTKGAVLLVSGRYLATTGAAPTPATARTTSKPTTAATAPAGGPALNLFPGLGVVPPSAPLSKQELKNMKRATEQMGVREAVRQAVAAGKRDRDEVATATGITLKQATDALGQLARLGELEIIRAGRRGEPAQYATRMTLKQGTDAQGQLAPYAVGSKGAAAAPRKRGRPAGGAKAAGKPVDKPAAKKTRGPYKKRKAGRTAEASPRTALVVPAQIETHLVAMQADGGVIVIDQAANTIETIAPQVVQQILRFASMRAAA